MCISPSKTVAMMHLLIHRVSPARAGCIIASWLVRILDDECVLTPGDQIPCPYSRHAQFAHSSAGTGISMFGFFPANNPAFPWNLSYSVSLDGIPTTNYVSSDISGDNVTTDVLASFTNLTNTQHSVTMTMHNSGNAIGPDPSLLFDRAIIMSSIPTNTS